MEATTENIHRVLRDTLLPPIGGSVPDFDSETMLSDAEFAADSLVMVEIAVAMEEAFGIEIPDDEFEGWKLVRDVEQTVAKHVAGKAVAV